VLIGVRADAEYHDNRHVLALCEVCQQGQKGRTFLPPLDAEQFLCLVDRNHESRRTLGLIARHPLIQRLSNAFRKQRQQRARPLLHGIANLGAGSLRQDGRQDLD
jgi:hypothetical protein